MGLLSNGGSLVKVDEVKREIKLHFEKSFKEIIHRRNVLRVWFLSIYRWKRDYRWNFFSLRMKLKKVVWTRASDKSSGPSDFNLYFFNECWDLIKVDVLDLVKEFQLNVKLPKTVTSSFLSLIMKVDNRQELDDYMFICLISNIYRILSNFIANMLKMY